MAITHVYRMVLRIKYVSEIQSVTSNENSFYFNYKSDYIWNLVSKCNKNTESILSTHIPRRQ